MAPKDGPDVRIRPATWRDVSFVLRVRNEPASLMWSANSGKVGRLQHLLWWFGKSANKELVYIVFIGRVRSGYVRVKASTSGLAEISVALSAATHGQGAGRRAIEEAMCQTADIRGLLGWQARIHRDNAPSLNAFASAGFTPMTPAGGPESPWLKLERRLR